MKKIIIIGKKEDNTKSIQSMISEGFPSCKILICPPAIESVDRARNEKPDIILVQSTASESLDICAKLKTKDTPFLLILLAPRSMSSADRQEFKDAGVDAFTTSPPEPVELTALIKMLGDKKSTEDQLKATSKKLDEKVLTRTDLLKESEVKNHLLVENAPYCIHLIDPEGKLMSMNAADLRMMGAKNEKEIIGKPYLDTIAESDREKIEQLLQSAIQGKASEFEFNSCNNLIFKSCFIPITSSASKVDGVMGITQDITALKHSEEELRQQEMKIKQQNEFLNTVIESLTYPFYVIDANNYKIKMANSATGINLKHNNITCHLITHGNEIPCQNPEHPCPIDIVKQTKKPVIVQHFHYDQNNNLRNVEVHGYPIINKKGEVDEIIEYCLDVTEQKRTENIQRVLYNISNAVTSTDSLENLIRRIQEELGTILDTYNFYIALYHAESDTIVSPYYVDEKDQFKTIPAGKTLTKYVIDTQKPLLANLDKKKELMAQGKIETFGSLSKVWLGVPLKIDGGVTGVLAVQSYTNEKAFNESDMKVLEFVSDQISISIDRKKAEDELKLHREHLEELVKDRTLELEEKNVELERFNSLFIGREFRIKELRDKVKELEKKIIE